MIPEGRFFMDWDRVGLGNFDLGRLHLKAKP